MSIPHTSALSIRRTEIPYPADLCKQFLAWDSYGSLLCIENPQQNPADILRTYHNTLLAHLPTILSEVKTQQHWGSADELEIHTTIFLDHLFDTYFLQLPPAHAVEDPVSGGTYYTVPEHHLRLYVNLLECMWYAPILWPRIKPLLGLCLSLTYLSFSVTHTLLQHPHTPRFVLEWIVEEYGDFLDILQPVRHAHPHRLTEEEKARQIRIAMYDRKREQLTAQQIEDWRIPSKLDAFCSPNTKSSGSFAELLAKRLRIPLAQFRKSLAAKVDG